MMGGLIAKINDQLEHWIFEKFKLSSEGLGLFRITYCLFIIIYYGMPGSAWIAAQPQYYFNPHLFNVATLAGDFLPAGIMYGLDILIAIGFVMLLAGWHTKKVSLLLPLIIILTKSFHFSFGKIDHDIFAWIVPLIMVCSGWGETFSIDRTNHIKKGKPLAKPQGWPISLMALLLGFGFLSAGIPKLLGGWLATSSQAVQAHLTYNYFVVGRQELLAQAAMNFDSQVFWEFMDWTAVFFEFAFILAIAKKASLKVALLVVCGFHLLNLLLFNISFSGNYGAYLLFLPWNRIGAQFKLLPKQFPGYYKFIALGICILGAAISWSRLPADRPLWQDLAVLIGFTILFLLNLFIKDWSFKSTDNTNLLDQSPSSS